MNVAMRSQQIDLACEPAFTLGAVQVLPATREVIANGEREVLEPRVMQVLVALHRRQGEVVSRDELIATCWGGRIVGEDAIHRCGARIRRLAETFGGFSLQTIPRVGYRLMETTDQIPISATTAVQDAATPASPRDGPAAVRSRALSVAAVVLALIAVACGVAYWVLRPAANERVPAKVLIVEAPVKSPLAVLPFTPLYANPEAQLLGDSIASTIADTLSRGGLHVISPEKSFQFRGTAKAHAARALNAAFVIDGEVRRDGDRVSVSLRLDDASDGTTILARTFEQPSARSAMLADQVATFITGLNWGADFTALDPRVAAGILRNLEQTDRGDYFAAYDTARSIAKMVPASADAQTSYAWAAATLMGVVPANRKQALLSEARQAAASAMRLNPRCADTYSLLTKTTPYFLWAKREDYLRQAMALPKQSIGATNHLGGLLADSGRVRDAEPLARSVYERFPFNTYIFHTAADVTLALGNAADSRPIIARAHELWPDDVSFAAEMVEATAFNGALADAKAFLRERETVNHVPAATVKTWDHIVDALRDHRAEDIKTVSRDCSNPGEGWGSCMMALTMLGKLDEAFRIADAAYPDQRAATPAAVERRWLATSVSATRYLFLPQTAPLRADPRFRDVVERIGLLQYWKAAHHPPDFCATEKAPVCQLLKS
jgi:TolB-like protein/DNA-binding winged helix-turn-helix (wHTH) protein